MNTPTILVIFGATGDLSRKKLLTALFNLYQKNVLPVQFYIVGFSRRELTDTEFRNFVKDALTEKGKARGANLLDAFLSKIYYQTGVFEDPTAYRALGVLLKNIDEKEVQGCANKLYYLAMGPESYARVFDKLADSGLTIPCIDNEGWTRVVVEKPFGKDLDTARELDQRLGALFEERQIFRIDHYLAKETIQNILAFRFSNILFEPLWSNQYIERIEINLHEQFSIEGRGTFYDGVGALRDVGQNHMLQMLSLVAMEDPKELQAVRIRRERARALSALRLFKGTDGVLYRGQYRGYRAETGVAADSTTETFFRITAEVNTKRWHGVPWILESGKCLSETRTEIQIYFKKTETCLCPPEAEHHHQNILTFRIQPNEGISVVFWAKKPGFATKLEPRELTFQYKNAGESAMLPDAYERVLYDCIRGDQTLFASTEEVEASWKFITPIIDQWHSVPLVEYDKGIVWKIN